MSGPERLLQAHQSGSDKQSPARKAQGATAGRQCGFPQKPPLPPCVGGACLSGPEGLSQTHRSGSDKQSPLLSKRGTETNSIGRASCDSLQRSQSDLSFVFAGAVCHTAAEYPGYIGRCRAAPAAPAVVRCEASGRQARSAG